MKSEWAEKKLNSLCIRLSSGKGIRASEMDRKYSIPVYGGNGVRGYVAKGNFVGDCAIIGRQGAYCGNVRYFNGEAYMTEHAVVAQANDENCTRYLAYALSRMKLGRLSGQSAQPGLSVKVLGEQTLLVPPLPTQRKIAAILSALDDKIEANNAICRNLEEQIIAIFRDVFMTRETDMHYVKLEELCTCVTKGTTPTTLGHKFTERGVNFIKAESITDTHDFESMKFAHISQKTHDVLSRSQLQENDILFSIAGTLGRFAMTDKQNLPANTNQAVAIIRANDKMICPEYLYSLFIGNWHVVYYTKHIQQAVQANLSLTTIKSLPIPILNKQEMEDYVGYIRPLIHQIKVLSSENRRLASLRDTLLPRLMSGEPDVSPLNL